MAGFWSKLRDTLAGTKAAAYQGITWLGTTGDLDAGVVVGREEALEIPAHCACIMMLATDVGQVPIGVYERAGSERRRADESSVHAARLFALGPNRYQTCQDWVEQLMLHLLTRGDHYARVARVGGQVDQLYPITGPHEVLTQVSAGAKVHRWMDAVYAGAPANRDELAAAGLREMFHIHTASPDGYQGRDTVDVHRQTLSLAKAIFQYGANFYRNSGVPGVVLVLPPGAKKEDVEAAASNFRTRFGGAAGAWHSVAAYSNGTEVKTINVDPRNAQQVEAAALVDKRIAALHKMPLWRLWGEQPPTAEARNAYYADTLGPWFVRIAGNITKQLLPPGAYARFITAGLLAADIRTRSEAYRQQIESRILSPNEARELEERPPYAGGDEFVNPNTTAFQGPAGAAQ
jgi:HK97 family phage portal protein